MCHIKVLRFVKPRLRASLRFMTTGVLRLISFFVSSISASAGTGSASDGEIEQFIKRWLLTLNRDGGEKERDLNANKFF